MSTDFSMQPNRLVWITSIPRIDHTFQQPAVQLQSSLVCCPIGVESSESDFVRSLERSNSCRASLAKKG